MVSALTLRANALAIPLTHRDADALDAALAARLFRKDRKCRKDAALPDALMLRLAHPDGRKRRGARKDAALYDELGKFVHDDGFAVVSFRELLPRLGYRAASLAAVQRSVRRLAAEGSIEAHAWPWQRRKATAYRLPAFAAMLARADKLREPRAEIAALLEAPGESVNRPAGESVNRRERESVNTISSTPDSLKTQGPAARFHGQIAPERIYAEAEVNMRAAMTPEGFKRLMAANQDLERRRAEAAHLDAVRLDYKIDLLSRGLVGLTAGGG